MNLFRRQAIVFAAASAAAYAMPAFSQQLTAVGSDAKAAPAILTIEGATKDGKPVHLTRAELEKLPMTSVRTTTPWYDGVQTFEGVLMTDLMAFAGGKGKTANVTALNKYQTEVPFEDFARFKPILAIKRNGNEMPVRDKGPLFIVYPYDSDPALKTELYYGRSAWQVRQISIQP